MSISETTVRTVLITGAAGVLGRVMAHGLVAQGHRVMLTDLDEAALDDTANHAGKTEGRIAYVAADITAPGAAEVIVSATEEQLGPVDILVNNAALTAFAAWPSDADRPLPWEIDLRQVEKFFSINVVAQHALVSRVIPGMLGRSWGRIVNVTCSYDTMQRIYPYGTTKAALEAFAGALEAQLANTGVSANTINPGGPVATEIHMAKNPGRKWVSAEVMMGPLLWLASSASDGRRGRRYVGSLWNTQLPAEEAFEVASGPMGWSGFGEAALR